MGVKTQIDRITSAKESLKAAINAKGGKLTNELLQNYAAAIDALDDYSESIKNIIQKSGPEVKIPEGTTRITEGVFSNNRELVSVSFPSTLLEIYYAAFNNCENLALTELPNGITTIDTDAFYGCTNLALNKLPDALTMVGGSSFGECPNLNINIIPEKVEIIESNAFNNCTNLSKIWITKNCKTMEASRANRGPFRDCTNLKHIYTDASSKLSGWEAYWNYTGDSTKATVHYGVSKAQFEALL